MTQEKILDKLAKLKAAQEGEAKIGNTAAAEAFASMINKMLLQHELSMSDVEMRTQAVDDPIVQLRVDLASYGIKGVRARVGWQEALARIVAQANLCKFLVTPGSNVIHFVGTKAHTVVAEYAFGILTSSADRMSKDARDAYWREHRDDADFVSGNYRAAWIMGFTSRIAERFAEARREEVRAAGANTPGGSSTALVRLDQALVRAQDYIDNKFGGAKAAPTRMGFGISVGREAGRAAADKMHLGKGIGKGDGPKGQLKLK